MHLLWLWFALLFTFIHCSSLRAESPRSIVVGSVEPAKAIQVPPPPPLILDQGARQGPPRYLVAICISVDPQMYDECRARRAKLSDPKQCPGVKDGFTVIPLDDPRPEDITSTLAKLPRFTPVTIETHGSPFGGKTWRGKINEENPAAHYLLVKPGRGSIAENITVKNPNNLTERWPDTTLLKTSELLASIKAAQRDNQLWLSTCHSGLALQESSGVCLGADCRADESSYGGSQGEAYALDELERILCHKEVFDSLAKGTGEISPADLGAHFCRTFGGKLLEPMRYYIVKSSQTKSFADAPRTDTADSAPMEYLADDAALEAQKKLKAQQYPGKKIELVAMPARFQVRYTSSDGTEKLLFVGAVASCKDRGCATAEYSSRNPGWQKDCSSLVNAEAKKCSLEEVGTAHSLAVRDDCDSCVSLSCGEVYFHPQIGSFRLHSPYELPAKPAQGSRPLSAPAKQLITPPAHASP